MPICVRSVGNLLDRYDELLALSLSDVARLRRITAPAGRVILALDGLQPDVGHEVLWVLRDVLSGEVLLARSLLSSGHEDLARLISEVKEALEVPIAGVISDGQHSIRKAVAKALPGVPHQLCQYHDLREAARPIYEADRHAKVLLKKKVRGIRPIERKLEGRDDAEAVAARGYCAAVRSALTDDGRPPLEAPGLKLQGRLAAIAASLDQVAHEKGSKELTRLRAVLAKGLEATAASWPDVRSAYEWVRRASSILANQAGLDAAGVRARYEDLIAETTREAGCRQATGRCAAVGHFLKVTRSYWPGLFACYDAADLPRTNNDLEQFFGSYRYRRRASGGRWPRRGRGRGSVRMASAATRLRPVDGAVLAPTNPAAWRLLRRTLDRRQATRTLGRRFRSDPAAYLRSIEEALIKKTLPSLVFFQHNRQILEDCVLLGRNGTDPGRFVDGSHISCSGCRANHQRRAGHVLAPSRPGRAAV